MPCPLCKMSDCEGPEKEGPDCCSYAKARRDKPKPPPWEVVFQHTRGRIKTTHSRRGLKVRGAASAQDRRRSPLKLMRGGRR